jgi:pectate lyase
MSHAISRLFASILASLSLFSTCGLLQGADVPAFPGAEGFGSRTPGGRGGKVYVVTTLADYLPRREPPIAGSLRAAIEAEGPRIVVFRVSGLIELKAQLSIRNPFLTLAGQTAPGGGVCLKNYDVQIRSHDVVVRHLRVRPGDVSKRELDTLSVYRSQNVVIDHCSTSWGTDETLSVTGEDCTNVTVQWCLIAESLNESVHGKGAHGYGSLLRTDGDITFHHNLYAHHRSRCPRPGTYGKPRGILLDFRNNVIYDWGNPAGYTAADRATLNYIGNYLKPGPSTTNPKAVFKIGGDTTSLFAAGNYLVGGGAENEDSWLMISNLKDQHRVAAELPVAAVKTDSAQEAYRRVLDQAGATLPQRDAVDRRVVGEVQAGGGKIIDSQAQVGGWPEYSPGTPLADSDNDGMPDEWESRHGLNPQDAQDAGANRDGDGYTNVEEWINSLSKA